MALGEGLLEMALTVVREARSALEDRAPDAPARQDATPATPAPTPTSRVRRSRPAPSPRRRPAQAAEPATPPASPVPETAKSADDDPVPVAEFGGEGAEEGAGAEVSVAEPWDGYASMTAPQVRDRLQAADRETLAAVVLYEGFGKTRSSVIKDAERRLTRLSPPGS